MALKILIFLTALFSISPSFAQQRKPYVIEAGAEIGFYFVHLQSDATFMASLNIEERSQFAGILKIIQALDNSKGVQFKYSENPQDFILNPGEPERSAKTTEILTDPVIFNLRKLNSSETQIKYLDVVGILVHELGHKLGKDKIQVAVDSLSVKITDRLSAFASKEHVTWTGHETVPRPMNEFYETLSIPKSLRNTNIEPSAFFVDKTGPKKITFALKEHLKNVDADKVVHVQRVSGILLSGNLAEVRYSIFKPLKTSAGPRLVHEDSYMMRELIFPAGHFQIDGNFRVSRPRWIRNSTNFNFQVLSTMLISDNRKEVKWQVEFVGKPNAKKAYLIAGFEDNNSLWPCQILSTTAESTTAECTYKIPSVTGVSILKFLQLMVDGEVADLPELLQLDLEMDYKVRFDESQMRAQKFDRYEVQGRKTYDLTISSVYPIIKMITRCREQQDYVVQGRKEGFIDKTVEQIFMTDELPIKSKTQDQWVFTASCLTDKSEISEILITDEVGYSMSPRWR